jgi:hypothetical protein
MQTGKKIFQSFTKSQKMNNIEFNDFYKVPNIKFDIHKLKSDLEKILKKKRFNTLGITNFGAIPLNEIPGDKESTEGHKVRGTYWTLPDESGKEVLRDIPIDERKYTQLVSDFHNTYFEEVFNTLRKNFKLGRVRILLKQARSTLSWHRDPEPRLHIPIITNLGCRMVIGDVSKHMPADGSVTITNNTKYHNFFNGGEQSRIHLVACVLDDPFKKNGRI